MKTKMPTGASTNVSFNSQSKDTHSLSETQIFFNYLLEHVATCTMACIATGIKQKCATRYKRDLEKLNLLSEVDYKPCEITGYMASWLTTNPDLCPKNYNKQLSFLFEGGEL